MKTFIALFRGINVGGKNILPMKDLKKLFEELGCKQVKTYIQSGNVVFQIAENELTKFAARIGEAVSGKFGFTPKLLLLSFSDLEEAINNNPFLTENGKTLHFFFLENEANSPDLEALTALKTNTEEFKLYNNIFYLYAPDGIGRSKLAAQLEQKLGVSITARNWNTVSKLSNLANQV